MISWAVGYAHKREKTIMGVAYGHKREKTIMTVIENLQHWFAAYAQAASGSAS